MTTATGCTDANWIFVIGHELAHVKHQHGLKKLGAILGIFGVTGILTFWLSHIGLVGSVVVSFGAVFLPLVCVYFVSRRFEYAADRGAFELTGDAEAGHPPLSPTSNAHTRVPVTCTWIEEVFSNPSHSFAPCRCHYPGSRSKVGCRDPRAVSW